MIHTHMRAHIHMSYKYIYYNTLYILIIYIYYINYYSTFLDLMRRPVSPLYFLSPVGCVLFSFFFSVRKMVCHLYLSCVVQLLYVVYLKFECL